jgi:hypothetical protein
MIYHGIFQNKLVAERFVMKHLDKPWNCCKFDKYAVNWLLVN